MADSVCEVEGCLSPRVKREWCARHYQAWRRHGDPLGAAYEWAPKGNTTCVVCGATPLLPDSRRYCSKACSLAVSRGRTNPTAACQGCGDQIDVHREHGRAVKRSNTRWCADCKAQLQKHGVSAKQLARIHGSDCAECGQPVDLTITAPDPMSASIDRIIAQARGGTNDLANLQLVHRRCNQAKSDLLPHEREITTCSELGCDRKLASRAMGLCARHLDPYYRGVKFYPTEKRGHHAYWNAA